MSDLRQYPTTMVYAGGCSVDALFYIYWYYDLYKNAIGGPEARRNAYIALQRKSATLAVYTVAFCIASYQHLVVGESQNATVAHQINNNNNWPAYVLIGGYVFEFIVFNLTFTFWYLPKLGSHKDYFVPINLEYVTHRIGEWVMLMLGTCVRAVFCCWFGVCMISRRKYEFFIMWYLTPTYFPIRRRIGFKYLDRWKRRRANVSIRFLFDQFLLWNSHCHDVSVPFLSDSTIRG